MDRALLDLKFKNAITKNTHSIRLPKSPLFKFSFEYKIEGKQKTIFVIRNYWKPRLSSKEEFNKTLEKEFWQKFLRYFANKPDLMVGRFSEISKKFTEFNNNLNKYISEVQSKYETIATRTVVKKSGKEHFRWLIEYQIPPFLSYSELEQKIGRTRKTIREGVEDVADLIGLTLRKSKRGRKETTNKGT